MQLSWNGGRYTKNIKMEVLNCVSMTSPCVSASPGVSPGVGDENNKRKIQLFFRASYRMGIKSECIVVFSGRRTKSESSQNVLFFQGFEQNQNRVKMYCFFRASHKIRIDSECIVVFYRALFRNRIESEYIVVFTGLHSESESSQHSER